MLADVHLLLMRPAGRSGACPLTFENESAALFEAAACVDRLQDGGHLMRATSHFSHHHALHPAYGEPSDAFTLAGLGELSQGMHM